MTCLIALASTDALYLAADTATRLGRRRMLVRTSKLVQVSDRRGVGIAGIGGCAQRARTYLVSEQERLSGVSREMFLDDLSELVRTIAQDPDDLALLAVVDGELFAMGQAGGTGRATDLVTAGSAEYLALGALEAIRNHISGGEIAAIKKAMDIAARFNSSVSPIAEIMEFPRGDL